jgi:hypothetical protein
MEKPFKEFKPFFGGRFPACSAFAFQFSSRKFNETISALPETFMRSLGQTMREKVENSFSSVRLIS